ncbi:MAG: O-methyltransferase [Clostridiales bacterium]|nr:O-methyltransferase [Clostridiales bacterium]
MDVHVETVLKSLEEEEERRRREGRPSLLCVGREGGQLLHVPALLRKPMRVLEVGLSAGYSTLWMASALLPGACLYTVEKDPTKVKLARDHLRQAGLLDRVEILEGLALSHLKDLRQPLDMVFLDAAKDEYVAYLKAVEPLLTPGAVVVADNVLSHREALQPYVDYVRRHPAFRSFTFPLGNGLEVTVKIA